MLISGKYTSFVIVTEATMGTSDSTEEVKMPCECDDAQEVISITYQTEFGQGGFIWIPYKIKNDRVIFQREISVNNTDFELGGETLNLWR